MDAGPKIELRDLAYFRAIVEAGNLGRAADKVGRTQPALTKSVRRLEAALGVRLFERGGRGVKLTAIGEALLERTTVLQQAFETALHEVESFARGDAGHIRIGSIATATGYLLPELSERFFREAPAVTVDLVVGMSDMLRELLRAGELDLAIVPLQPVEDEFDPVAVTDDEMVVVARSDHPLVGKPATLADLQKFNWVLPAESVGLRQWLVSAFESSGVAPPNVQVETSSISLLPRLIAATNLLSFMSRRNVGVGSVGELLSEVVCEETTMRRTIGVLCRRDVYLSPAVHRMLGLVQRMRQSGEAGPAPVDAARAGRQNAA